MTLKPQSKDGRFQRWSTKHDTETANDVSIRVMEDVINLSHQPEYLQQLHSNLLYILTMQKFTFKNF